MNQWINRLSGVFFMALQTHYTAHPLCCLAQINCDVKPQSIWEEYKCNLLDFNSEIFPFWKLDDYFGEKASTKQQKQTVFCRLIDPLANCIR